MRDRSDDHLSPRHMLAAQIKTNFNISNDRFIFLAPLSIAVNEFHL